MGKIKLWCVLFLVMGLGSTEVIFAASSYTLDSQKSSLYFVSTKQTNIIENHFFTTLSGSISEQGIATLVIDLSSGETGIERRNQRFRSILFEVATAGFGEANVTLPVDMADLASQVVGSSQTQNVSATMNLHGVTSQINTDLIVTKLSSSSIVVQNAFPILIKAADYDLVGDQNSGIEGLRNAANLDVIGYTVPVNFTLIFDTP